MTIRNIAYLVLVAGWICFCYWLYAEGISPRLDRWRGKGSEARADTIPYPLAFRWASDVPVAGIGFENLRGEIQQATDSNEVIILHGYYFRDEALDEQQLTALGLRRIDSTIMRLGINPGIILKTVGPQEITSDAKSHPFEAIRVERFPLGSLLHMSGDTFELCFPVQDSFVLPPIMIDSLWSWMIAPEERTQTKIFITGTADGSGIAEPMDMAMERALWIKRAVLAKGWKEEQIQLSTGQRNHPLTIKNRCVIVYYD